MRVFLFIISNLLIIPSLYASEEFFEAIENENIAKIQFMVEVEGIDVNEPNKDGNTPLIKAASKKSIITKILLKAKADPKIENASKVTALHRSAEAGHIENAELLLEAGAEVDATDRWGETALIIAVQNEDLRMVRLILRYNPDLKITNNRGEGALTIAKRQKNPQIYNMLTPISKLSLPEQIFHSIKRILTTDTSVVEEIEGKKSENRCPY